MSPRANGRLCRTSVGKATGGIEASTGTVGESGSMVMMVKVDVNVDGG